ncbi:MAG TPA: tRNA 2-thiouridine(34) synthase MnmA [Candidatus Omnitrophica bacterium]|nr:tRNA 2-thiouridine(34) synthase MnmA [Candidatus Omnitrophota bacterium]
MAKILVAMSGGVDSSVAAALLKEQGHEVAGATMRTWASNSCENLNTKACCGITGVEDAREVADTLGIKYWVLNFEEEFKKYVIDYFAAEYLKGRTPNPCIACNEHIKFRLFLKRAQEMGFDSIATGHYAEVFKADNGLFALREGKDAVKDQTYVLFPLDQDVLSKLYLPCGGFSKAEIRDLAKKHNLNCVAGKAESMEICFIPDNNYGGFVEKEFNPKETVPSLSLPGVVKLKDGTVLGKHDGYFHFTHGQRRGINIAYKEKLYVLDIKPETNEVIVGTKDDVLGQTFVVDRVNWHAAPPAETFEAHVKIRSQHKKSPAIVTRLSPNQIEVSFLNKQEAITPGQGAVLYDGNVVLAGGWIGSAQIKACAS